MVAPQILVLHVGVRILLGELKKLTRYWISFFFCTMAAKAGYIGPFVYRLGRKILNL
jgi:hypothetical protein